MSAIIADFKYKKSLLLQANKILNNLNKNLEKELSNKNNSFSNEEILAKQNKIELNKASINENISFIQELKQEAKENKDIEYTNYKNNKKEIWNSYKKTNKEYKENKHNYSLDEYKVIKEQRNKERRSFFALRTYYDAKVYGDNKKHSVWAYTQSAIKYLFLFALFILFISPFYVLLTSVFKTSVEFVDNPFGLPINPTTENLKEAFGSISFFENFITTLWITVVSIVLIIFLSSLGAWALVRNKKWYSKAIFYSLVASMILPFQVLMFPINGLWGLEVIASIPPAIKLVISYVGFGAALTIFLMRGFIKSIPVSLEEAAVISGLNSFQVYYKIILPIMKPIIASIVILHTLWIWNDYLLPSLLFAGETEYLPLVVAFRAAMGGSYGASTVLRMAIILITIIPVVIFFFAAQKHIVKGVTQGSVK